MAPGGALWPTGRNRSAIPAKGLVIVDTATAKAAEDLPSTLGEALGSLPISPIIPRCLQLPPIHMKLRE
ncbi:hypothetical protein B8B74_05085 [Pseudomonas aeruginosa]|nr:hypothetical protein B8B74_05085 [Pseudomonas aeruginosa]